MANALPRSFAHLKREISEKKWLEAKMWADSRVTGKKYHYCAGAGGQKRHSAPAKSSKRLAARFYQLKTGHCLTGQYLKWTTGQVLVVFVQVADAGASFQELPPVEAPTDDPVGRSKETGGGNERFKIRDLFADSGAARRFWSFFLHGCGAKGGAGQGRGRCPE
jgi:hypothetical protein